MSQHSHCVKPVEVIVNEVAPEPGEPSVQNTSTNGMLSVRTQCISIAASQPIRSQLILIEMHGQMCIGMEALKLKLKTIIDSSKAIQKASPGHTKTTCFPCRFKHMRAELDANAVRMPMLCSQINRWLLLSCGTAAEELLHSY